MPGSGTESIYFRRPCSQRWTRATLQSITFHDIHNGLLTVVACVFSMSHHTIAISELLFVGGSMNKTSFCCCSVLFQDLPGSIARCSLIL